MTYSATERRPDRRELATHAFVIGQPVRLRDGIGRLVPPGALYRITGTLPSNGGSPQYRIRNDDERHERVAAENALQLAGPPANDDTTLIERTFGRG
jgi:hypothetical protein